MIYWVTIFILIIGMTIYRAIEVGRTKRLSTEWANMGRECEIDTQREMDNFRQRMADREVEHTAERVARDMVYQYETGLFDNWKFRKQNNLTSAECPYIGLVCEKEIPTIMSYGDCESKWDNQTYNDYVQQKYNEYKNQSSIVSMYSK